MQKYLTKIWKSYRIGVVVLVVGIVLSLISPRFFSFDNLLNVMTNASLVAIAHRVLSARTQRVDHSDKAKESQCCRNRWNIVGGDRI